MLTLTSTRLSSGYQAQLQELLAALLDVPLWRVTVSSADEWVIQNNRIMLHAHLLSPDSPADLTSLELHERLQAQLTVLSEQGVSSLNLTSSALEKAARFLDASNR